MENKTYLRLLGRRRDSGKKTPAKAGKDKTLRTLKRPGLAGETGGDVSPGQKGRGTGEGGQYKVGPVTEP